MNRNAIEYRIKLLEIRVRETATLVAKQQAVLRTLQKARRDATKAQEIVNHLLALKRTREVELERLRKKLAVAK